MSGYAAVFNQTTTLYDSKFLKLTESIARTFFDNVLRDQPMNSADGVVHFNFGHDMNRAVAATDVPPASRARCSSRADRRACFPGEGAAGRPGRRRDGREDAVGSSEAGVVRVHDRRLTSTHDARTTTASTRSIGRCSSQAPVRRLRLPAGRVSADRRSLRSYAAAIGQPPEWGGQHVSQPEAREA
jgi:hypothetical protein